MYSYSALAQYYDRFVGADYESIANYIDSALIKHFGRATLVCDIGCGSGNLTFKLLQKGYDMIGIDGSPEMLAEAINKRMDIVGGENALFLCQQLPEFELYGTVDAIVSTLDTVNYLTDDGELDRLFYWFHNYLNSKGILIFDVNTLYKYQTLLDQHCEIYDDEDVFLAWQSQFDGTYCSHKLSFFEKEKQSYYRTDEEQLQRYYAEEEIVSLLNKYHFNVLEICDDYSGKSTNKQTQRLTFIAQKED
jgi:SAM-dependent methyltransferase